MECFILSLVNVMPKNRQRAQRPAGKQIELVNPRYDPTVMSGFGKQMITAIGSSPAPTLFVGSRQLNQLSIAAGLVSFGRELVHVQDIIDNSVTLNPEIAAGIRYLATCFQLANPNFLCGHTETCGTIVGIQVRWVNHEELILRPCRQVRLVRERALDSLLRGQLSYSTR